MSLNSFKNGNYSWRNRNATIIETLEEARDFLAFEEKKAERRAFWASLEGQ